MIEVAKFGTDGSEVLIEDISNVLLVFCSVAIGQNGADRVTGAVEFAEFVDELPLFLNFIAV